MESKFPEDKLILSRHQMERLFANLSQLPETYRAIVEETSSELFATLDELHLLTGYLSSGTGSTEEVAERRRLEEELSRQRNDYQVIFDSVPALIFYLDETGRILRVNKRAAHMMGVSVDEVVNRRFSELFPREGGRILAKVGEIVRTGHAIWGSVEAMTFPSGETRWLKVDQIPYTTKLGKRLGVILFGQDITDSRKEEAGRRESEAKFRGIFERAGIGVALVDADWRILEANPAFRTMLGYSEHELPALRVPDFTHPDDLRRERTLALELFSGQRDRYQIEKRYICADGRVIWGRLTSSLVRGPDGSPRFAIGMVEDITARKTAEESLRESERRFKTLVSNIPGVTYRCLYDPIWSHVFISEEVEKITGYPVSTFLHNRKPYVDIIYPDDREKVERCIFQAVENHQPYSLDYRIVDAKGAVRWIMERGRAVYDSLGKVLWLDGVFLDVTEKKQAEEALRESEAKYRLLAENVTDVIWTVDMNRRFTYVSPSILYLVGYSVEEVLTMRMEDLATQSSLDLALEIIAEEIALRGANPETWPRSRTVEVELVRKDGSHVWAEVTANFLTDSSEAIYGISGVARDVTERRKVQEALRESEARYRSFVRNFQGVAFRSNEEFIPVFMHGAVEAVTGYTEEEFLDGTIRWDKLVHPDDAAEYGQQVKRLKLGPESSAQREYRIVRKDGEVRWIREMVQKMSDGCGGEMYQGAIYDITERKQAASELSEYRENMIRAEQLASLGTIGAMIAHQLNQPLTGIRLFLQQALRTLSEMSCCEKVKENLTDSLTEVSNAIAITKQFLTFARRRQDEEIQMVQIHSVAEKVVTVLSESTRNGTIELVVDDMRNLPAIECHMGDMEQIFFILAQNAIQAADGNRRCRLVIRGKVFEDRVDLIFADNCCGIVREDLDKIFEPFYTTKPPGQGTGLGLSILQRIVSKYGGKVHVDSESGKGTTFRVSLPIHI